MAATAASLVAAAADQVTSHANGHEVREGHLNGADHGDADGDRGGNAKNMITGRRRQGQGHHGARGGVKKHKSPSDSQSPRQKRAIEEKEAAISKESRWW